MPGPLQLPPETAWLVPLLTVGVVFTVLVILVALHFVRKLVASDDDTDELRSRVDSLEDEVEELRESQSEARTESQTDAD